MHLCTRDYPVQKKKENGGELPKLQTAGKFRAVVPLCQKFVSLRNSEKCSNFCIFFRHFNFQKSSAAEVFYIFNWLYTSHYNGVYFFDILPSKTVREWFILYVSTLFYLYSIAVCNFLSLIWPGSSVPAPFARLLFDPPEPQIIGKTQ